MATKILSQVYDLRRKFIIIGLTGRTGSGCTTVADILTEEFDKFRTNYRKKNDGDITNETRKDAIVHNFLIKGNWVPFEKITASDIIYLFAFTNSFEEFKALFVEDIDNESRRLEVQKALDGLETKYKDVNVKATDLFDSLINKKYLNQDITKETLEKQWLFLKEDIPNFRTTLTDALSKIDKKILTSELQKWGNNVRKIGSVGSVPNEKIIKYSPACLAFIINRIAKLIRRIHELEKEPRYTRIVIDALRNPFEILYFRERFSAFYTISVSTDQQTRYDRLSEKGISKQEAHAIDNSEKSKGDFSTSYQEIDVDRCIELSDIFLTHNGTPSERNRDLHNQIARYIALILHPGLIPPSPLERVMQIAYTAKLNSGCLSRQVGAVVTDEYFSVKAVGWNTVAEGQTPCSLRSLRDLIDDEDPKAYSEFEKTNSTFSNYAHNLFTAYNCLGESDRNKLCTIGMPFCFKDLYTTCFPKHKGNQVHTRSLHAEENAFLQLAKYGSEGIKGGMLFTTASCCELCGKKAYQLGIRKIYYIDSYPGITESHILKCGTNSPEMILFHGAIGRAYLSLYDPFLPLKDEIRELTGINTKDPIDYSRSIKDREETQNCINIRCNNSEQLANDIINDIGNGRIESWGLDCNTDITSSDDKQRLCWFRISHCDDSLILTLIYSKKLDEGNRKRMKAIYSGRILDTLITYYQEQILSIDFNKFL